MRSRKWRAIGFIGVLSLFLSPSISFSAQPNCCSENPELSYFLYPKPYQRYSYLVRYETFYSRVLEKEKGFFVILPEDFEKKPKDRYPILFLLHGYNFERRGFWWKVHSPEKAKRVLCEAREEEFHWLLHEDIALIAYAMMNPKNRTYQDLKRDLKDRFEELFRYGGLDPKDNLPNEIAQSIVFHNLLLGKKSERPFFSPLQKMIIILPDGDNGFYIDENEGKTLFPPTQSRHSCDDFSRGESLNFSLIPFLYMKPGALGKYESYFLELVHFIERDSHYRNRILPIRGLGGFSMGGFGAMRLGLKYPHLFHSISSQSGLLDLELFSNKWMLKMVLPEFLEIFGSLRPKRLPSASNLDSSFIRSHNPIRLVQEKGISKLPPWIYFDYGEREGILEIIQGNRNFEKVTGEGTHEIPVQPFNGKAGHNYRFWRSRSGNILNHHSEIFKEKIEKGLWF